MIQLEEAVRCFEKALEFSNQEDGEAYFNLGKIYRKLKKNDKAINFFDEAVKKLKHQEQYNAYI